MIRRLWELIVIVSHDVWHGNADATLLVIQHQYRIAIGAKADLQWTPWIASVERYALDRLGMINLQVAVVEEDHVCGVLLGHRLADIAVAFVVVDGFGGGSDMHMRASSRVFCCHGLALLETAPWSGRPAAD
jgi:hypothetical protein